MTYKVDTIRKIVQFLETVESEDLKHILFNYEGYSIVFWNSNSKEN